MSVATESESSSSSSSSNYKTAVKIDNQIINVETKEIIKKTVIKRECLENK